MRILSEIIGDVKDGQVPSEDEMRFAICVLDALSTFDHLALMHLSEAEAENKKKILTYSAVWQWEEAFNRWKRALNVDPKTYLGENNNPDNPACQQRRRVSKKIFDKVISRSTR